MLGWEDLKKEYQSNIGYLLTAAVAAIVLVVAGHANYAVMVVSLMTAIWVMAPPIEHDLTCNCGKKYGVRGIALACAYGVAIVGVGMAMYAALTLAKLQHLGLLRALDQLKD
jgi:hypothetical protein